MDKLDKNKVLKANTNNDYERNCISEGFNSISKLENQELINKQINSSSNADQQSMYKVNIAAALHDHISCTKLQTDLSRTEDGLLTLSLNINSNKNKEIENDDLEEDEENFELGFNEQDFALKEIIMGQLDLIQHQQEQLLKKERQLQSIKQDREQLFKKIDNMEKEIYNLKDQLSRKEENKLKKQPNEQFIDINKDTSELCLTGSSGEPLTFCNFLTDPSNILSSTNLYSPQTTDQQFQKVTLTNKSSLIHSPQLSANKFNENETEKMEVEISSTNKKINEDKKRKKSSGKDKTDLTDQEDKKKESSSKKKSLSTKKAIDKSSTVNNKDAKKLATDKQKIIQQNDLSNTTVEDEQQVYLQGLIKTIETDNPYELVTNRDYFNSLDEDNDLDNLQSKACNQSNIEIPSWRLHQVSCSYSLGKYFLNLKFINFINFLNLLIFFCHFYIQI